MRIATWLTLAAAVTLTVTTAACTRKKDQDTRVIRVSRNIGSREGFRRHWVAWKAAFERDNPGWTMQLIDLADQDNMQFYKTRGASGDLPEVMMTWHLTDQLVDAGYLLPLPDGGRTHTYEGTLYDAGYDYYDKFGLEPPPKPYPDKRYDKPKRYNGQGGTQLFGMAVNLDLWEKVGITEPPKTWARFVAGLEKIDAYFRAQGMDKQGYRAVTYGAGDWSGGFIVQSTMCTDLYARDRSKPAADNPGEPSWTTLRNRGKVRFKTDPNARIIARNLIDFVTRFGGKGTLSSEYPHQQTAFFSGKAATWIMGCWTLGEIETQMDAENPFRMDLWPQPSMTGKPLQYVDLSECPSGYALSVTATGEKYDKALRVLEAFYDPKVYQLYLNGEAQFGNAGKVPVTKPASDNANAQAAYDRVAGHLKTYGRTPGYFIALDDVVPHAFGSRMGQSVERVLVDQDNGKTTRVDEFLEILDKAWDDALKSK